MNRYPPQTLAFDGGSNDVKVSMVNPLPIDSTKLRSQVVQTLLSAVIVQGTSAVVQLGAANRTVKASVVGTGALTATVTFYGSHTNSTSGGYAFATLALSGSTSVVGGAASVEWWPYVYAVLTNLTGTGATVSASIAV